MRPLNHSSNIKATDTDGDDLLVQFHSGHTYRYKGAAWREAELRASGSAGQFLHRIVKPHYAAEKINE